MTRTTLEAEIQREIELAIGAEPDLLLLRNSVGHAVYYNDDGKKRVVAYGLGPGSPDLVGLLRVETRPGVSVAVWLCIEVKAPEGTVDPEQEKCHAIWRRFGALVYVARSVDDARDALARARRLEA